MNQRPATILVVDDDEAKRYTITRILQQQGFQIEQAESGAAALAAAQKGPDLIVLDVSLPDISGIDVCRQIKASPQTSNIPVLHISARFVKSEDRVEGLDSGADGYLTDVVNPPEFIATVRSLLRARKAERALRESEERFRLLVQNVREYAIFTCSNAGLITTWNEGVQRIFGYSQAEFVGQPFKILFVADEEAEADLAKARAEQQVESELWQKRSDGTTFFANAATTAIYDDSQELIGFTTIVRDITERRAVEEERNRLLAREQFARQEAERANNLKDDFLATLSHELRTPLMAILGWTQLLSSRRLSAEDVETGHAVIDRNAKAQAQLIEDLLDVSRIISGKLRLTIERMDVLPVINAAIDSIRAAADAKQIKVETICDPKSGTIAGDQGRIQQIVWNLLSNAIKFTSKGGRVTVRLSRVNGYVEIAVEDNGQGIDPDFLPYVFDRFRQADASTKRAHAGLGLGLAIVRHLTELHGGTVRATSKGAGQGAQFAIRLPVAAVQETAATEPGGPVASRAAYARDPEMPNLEGLQILIVEDEPDARELLQRVFEQCGARVSTASSASEGVERFRTARPDLLISDIGMPGEDGYAFIKQIRTMESSLSRKVPAVALTAFARHEDRNKVLQAGFQAHVPKPATPTELVAIVESLTGRSNA